MVNKDTYTVQEIADATGVTRQSVYRLIRSKKLKPAVKADGVARYSKKAKDTILAHYGLLETPKATADKNDGNQVTEALRSEIGSLKKQIEMQAQTIEILKNELEVKNKQIEIANTLANQAQQLNLLDKPRKNHAESDNLGKGSNDNLDNHSTETAEKPSRHWFTSIFKH